MKTYTMTSSGPVSTVDHLHILVTPQATTVLCDHCDQSFRRTGIVTMQPIVDWMRAHATH
jgi:hypothetical protein